MNRWLAYLIEELKGIKEREAREKLTLMCFSALADELGVRPEDGRPDYIG